MALKEIFRGMENGADAINQNFLEIGNGLKAWADNTFSEKQTFSKGIKVSNIETPDEKIIKAEVVTFGGLKFNFRETATGVEVYINGTARNIGTQWSWTNLSEIIPNNITKPKVSVTANLFSSSGISGVTSRMPLALFVAFNTDSKISYKLWQLDGNNYNNYRFDGIQVDGYANWLK
ncbi:hypothetical protein [Leuconostoc pseudomesenteroides]|uniref:hypothetical protein n=1 Tax=Leuconostoc pseudomesenteroides TaxID=33968 RepID=UPI0032DF4241